MTFVTGVRHIQLIKSALASDDLPADQEQPLDALFRASLTGNMAAVKALLNRGLNANAKDRHGWTPLLEAVFGGHIDIVRLLLDKGADVNAPDQAGWTPLMEAASKGHTEIIKILLVYGAQVNVTTPESWTALSVTAKRNRKISRLLKGTGQ